MAAGTNREVVFGWGKGIGAPKLKGNTATYPGSAGVDVRVEATRTGFESFFDVKDAATLNSLVLADGPAKGRVGVSFPVKTKGLTAKAETDGSVSFTDGKGVTRSRLVPPRAWDAKVDPRSGLPGEAPARLDVTQQGKGKATVTVSVDASWAKDPARVFPITLDPTYATGSNISPSFDTRVQTDGGTLDYSSDTELRVGTFNGGSTVARSFIMFPTAAVQGKQVVSASLSLYENWSYSCTGSGMTLSTSGAPSTATRWGSQPAIYSVFTTASFAKGSSSSCPAGRVSLNMLPLVASAQANGWSAMAVALKAANESDSNGWKRFGSSESANPPYVTWTYNRAPNQAAAPTFLASGIYGSVGYVVGGRVTFTTKATDADASQVKALIEVHNSTTVSASSKVASCTTPLGASGTEIKCVNDVDIPNGGTYYVRALTTDEKGLSAGSWSSWTTIRRAGTAPTAPTISCPGYVNGAWTSGSPSADVTCTISTSGSGVLAATRLDIYVDGASTPTKSVDAKQAPTSTTVVIPKTAQGGHSVRAVATNGASVSSTTTSSFGWGPASMVTPINGSSTSGKVQVTATGTATNVNTTAQVQWRPAGSTTWTPGPTIGVTTSGGKATASGSVDTTSFITTAETKPGAKDGITLPVRVPVTLELQVCFTFTSGGSQCTYAQSPNTVTRLPHAFGGGYPTKDAGPGQVAQYTGEYQMSATDVSVPGLSGDLSISRSYLSTTGDGTLGGWPRGDATTAPDVSTSIFGPGWTANLDGPDAGTAGMQVVDNTTIDGTIALVDDDGSALVFRQPDGTRARMKPGIYAPVTQDTIDSGLKLEVTGSPMTIKVTDTDGTLTTYTPTDSSKTVIAFSAASVAEPGAAGTTTYTRDSAGRPTRITSGLPDGFKDTDCPSTGVGKAGCRYLDITYGTTNAGTDAAPGDRTGQIKSVSSVLWNPATSAMESTPMATYAYDGSGRLVKVTDSRTGLTTTYGWQGATGDNPRTLITAVTPSGLAGYTLTYDNTSQHKITSVTRAAPTTGGKSVQLASFFYNLPVSSTPIPGLAATADSKWAQASAPVTAFAMFGQDHPVLPGLDITAADWPYADLSYTDDLGYEVNTASYGAGKWLITATDYDQKTGNVLRTFDAAATSGLINGQYDPATANQYSSQTKYDDTGTLVTETTTPATTVTLPDGTVLEGARRKVSTTYDDNAPNGGINPKTGTKYNLPTTITTTVGGTTVQLGRPRPGQGRCASPSPGLPRRPGRRC